MAEFSPTPRVILSTQPDTINSRKTAGPEVVVRLQALDGTWETCGVDRAAGIFPENVTLSADQWGPKTASFDLRRDPSLPWPDVLAFTPVKIEVDGQLVWSGRVTETPSREGSETVMSVTCEGWQHHLDDDLLQRVWVAADLTRWKNYGENINANPSSWPTSWTVSAGDGALRITWPADLKPSGGGLVYFDAGPGGKIRRITWKRSSSNWGGNNALYVLGFNTLYSPETTVSLGSQSAVTDNAGSQSFGVGYRYVAFRMDANSWGSASTTDCWVSFKDVNILTDTSFDSNGSSVLKASTVVADVVASAAPLLSSNTGTIAATALNLPEYAPEEPRTPREHINAVNGFHGWTTKVDAFRRMNYYAKPSRAKYSIGEYSLKESAGSSGSAGAEIYNKVLVSGQDAGGNPVQITRYSGDAQGGFVPDTDLTWINPFFTGTDVSHWSVYNGGAGVAFTRTTTAGEYVSAPAAGKLSCPNGIYGSAYMEASGVTVPSRVYKVTFKARSSTSNVGMNVTITAASGTPTDAGTLYLQGGALPTTFTTFTLMVTPTSTDPFVLVLDINNNTGSTASVMIDDLTIESSQRTLPDRRDFLRAFHLSVNTVLPADGVLAAAIGDAWLSNHVTTTFKGDVTVAGPQSVRDRLSGQPVPLYQLLADTDELVYFSDRIDPDTGGMGRTGRITNVTYTPADDKAVLTLDNTRTDFETLLTRLGAT